MLKLIGPHSHTVHMPQLYILQRTTRALMSDSFSSSTEPHLSEDTTFPPLSRSCPDPNVFYFIF